MHERCCQIRSAADTFATSLRKEIITQLGKIPKKVRGITLREFVKGFGGDVSANLLATLTESVEKVDDGIENKDKGDENNKEEHTNRGSGRKRGIASTMLDGARGDNDTKKGVAVTTTSSPTHAAEHDENSPQASKKQKIDVPVLCTPVDMKTKTQRTRMGTMYVAKTPGTTRNPVRGEVVYSKNGSPLGAAEDDSDEDEDFGNENERRAPSSVVKRVTMTAGKGLRPAGNASDDKPSRRSGGLVLTTDDGKEIDVSAIGDGASGAEVEETVGMLAKMQQQVAAHMARLMAGRKG